MLTHHFDNRLIVVEGIDGTGKTTLTAMLRDHLNQMSKSEIDQFTKRFLKEQLVKFLEPDSMELLFHSLAYNGAVRFEDLHVKDATYQVKREEKFDIDFSFYAYLLSAIQKDHIVRLLLPYVHIIMDRYVYSVIAHYNVRGAKTESVNVDSFPITKPDFFFLFITEEEERRDRIAKRAVITKGDRRLKYPGSELDNIELCFKSFGPTIIDTTNQTPQETLLALLSAIQKREKDRVVARWARLSLASAFDNDIYLEAQTTAILNKIKTAPKGGNVYIEFGGKAFDDKHAARVLPGYDPDIKVKLLKNLTHAVDIVVVVSARDILNPRIRGDSQLFYGRETIRLIATLKKGGIETKHGMVTMVRNDYTINEQDAINGFIESTQSEEGVLFKQYKFIHGYPNPHAVFDQESLLSGDHRISTENKNILVLSPGGGSGKFNVCLSQVCHDFISGVNSLFMKFETFPVFGLPPDHPVNLAFVVATADLGNTLNIEEETGLTSYDKDMENFVLLKEAIARFCPNQKANPMTRYKQPSDMGINKLISGFRDEEAIKRAAVKEIRRRIDRYQFEIDHGIELENTMDHVRNILLGTPHSI